MADSTIPDKLQDSKGTLPADQFQLCVKLYNLGQEHVFESWESMSVADRKALAAQLKSLDKEYTDGGLVGYINNARQLLANSAKGVNPLENWKPEIPTGFNLELGTDAYKETEELGLPELGSVGFVLVAGGLGERLGYSSIKIGLPTEMTTETPYIQYYIEYILAVQKKYAPRGRKLPLCIMTSNDTHQKTVELLNKNRYFGMDKSQVTIVIQGQGVPALMDNDAKFSINKEEDGSKVTVVTKPHGHGDIHALLYKDGVVKKWKARNIKWLCLFQDTNGLAFHTLPILLGTSAKLNLIMNSLTVPRKAKQAIGAVTKLVNTKTNEVRTINVEYNQLDPLLRASGYPDGDVNDPSTGYSPFPGNINQLLFRVEEYSDLLEKTKGLMPEFVNPKYKDETKTVFKKPTRLECMMQDFPTIVPSEQADRIGFTSIAAELCFSPVKNATSDGQALQAKGTAPGTAATGEADQYQAIRKIMQSIGCSVEDASPETFNGITVIPGPAIVVKPNFAACPAEYPRRFPTPERIRISPRSTLVVRGRNVTIHSLDLDGALIIDVSDNEHVEIDGLVVENEGWVREPLDEEHHHLSDYLHSVPEVIQMRGYRIQRHATTVIKRQHDVTKAIVGDHGFGCVDLCNVL